MKITSRLSTATYAVRPGLTAGTPDKLARFRDSRVRNLIAHAWDHIPYYRDLMDQHGIKPKDIRGVDDLKYFPISRKDDFQAHASQPLLDRRLDSRKLVLHQTSGSTGQPLRIYRSWAEERIYGAFRWAVLNEYGYRARELHIDLEENTEYRNGDNASVHKLASRVGLFRQHRIQAMKPPAEICAELLKRLPQALSGYTGVISRVAEHLLETGETSIRPKFVAVHSDLLTPGMRERMVKAFECPVFEIYDAYEINVVAWQCPEYAHLHSADACAVIELVQDGRNVGPGERGEVVLTALHSYAMPFIRYAIGDIATRAGPCPCGRASATLSSIDGRVVEYFPLPDGRVLHPYEIYNALSAPSWVNQYQLVQEKMDTLRLDVVPTHPMNERDIEPLLADVRALLGAGVDFQVRLTDRIGPGKHSKSQAFRSLVKNI